jgi:carboxypeptidase-like protein/putative zinc finger protein
MQHLDEGTIHAMLDGELPYAEREEAEAHIAECEECAAAVAEARGFIAASSRILMALDSVPGRVVPTKERNEAGTFHTPPRLTMSRASWLRAGSAIAAVLILSTVTVIAVRQGGDLAQPRIAAVSRNDKELTTSAAPAESKTMATNPAAQSRANESAAVDAPATASPVTPSVSAPAAQAGGNAASEISPAPMPSRVAAPAEAPKQVDQTERLKSRLEAERKSTLARPSEPASNAMADAGDPASSDRIAERSVPRPAAAPAAPPVAKDAFQTLGAASSKLDSGSDTRGAASAQGFTITGRVTSEAGAPLAGASVMIPGSSIGTITREDGSYVLNAPAGRATQEMTSLVAKRIGYKSVVAPITPSDTAITRDIVLASNPLALGVVVVTGEGTTSAGEKLESTVPGVDAAPTLVSRETTLEGQDTVVTTVYDVHGVQLSLIDRSPSWQRALRVQSRSITAPKAMKANGVAAPVNSITWSDSTGHTRTLRGALPSAELEAVKQKLFGATP